MRLDNERIQQLIDVVNGAPPTQQDIEKMSLNAEDLLARRSPLLESAAVKAFRDGGCPRIPSTCILCARGKIDCNGVREIVIGDVQPYRMDA